MGQLQTSICRSTRASQGKEGESNGEMYGGERNVCGDGNGWMDVWPG